MKKLLTAIFCIITFCTNSVALELDVDSNGFIDVAFGGSNADTASGARTNYGLVIGTDIQAWDADLDIYATLPPAANTQSLLGAANYAAWRAQLDLEAGTDFYSISAADSAFQPLATVLTNTTAAFVTAYETIIGYITVTQAVNLDTIESDTANNTSASHTQGTDTSVGTIATGVWQGTAINATYLNGQSGTNTGDNTVCTSGAATTAVTATSLAGGVGGTIPYQSSAGTTAMLANGTAGQVLTSAGTTLAPTWGAAGAGDVSAAAVITDDGLVCGDGGAKGVKDCDAAISSAILSSTDTGPSDWIACTGVDTPVTGCPGASGAILSSGAERKIECVAISDQTTAFTVDTALETIRAPYAFTLTNVRASVITAPTGAILIIDINESGTTVMTTNKLSIDATELTSVTAATAPGITDSAIADDAVITFDIDQIGSSVAGAGAKVCLYGY